MDPTQIVKLNELRTGFEGEIYSDDARRILYATDASAYRELPFGVAYPKNTADLKRLIAFAGDAGIPLIPRAAGTSLAGQVVGSGLVVDVSKYMTAILEINPEEHWVRVEPGVILDELNKFAEPYGLFFGPETSTSSRCMIGGMVGNNSCGAHSIIYGSTRDHTVSVKCLLSDGSEAEFSDITLEQFEEKIRLETMEGKLYLQIHEILSDPSNQEEIRREYPDVSIHRRNTGYAIDLLLETEPFSPQSAVGSTQYSVLSPQSSVLTAHRSPLTAHRSLLNSPPTSPSTAPAPFPPARHWAASRAIRGCRTYNPRRIPCGYASARPPVFRFRRLFLPC